MTDSANPSVTADEIDTASVDAALTTTRAVRKRLDLTKPVDNDLIMECIDIAEQAPSGGNQGSRRWVVVTDPDVKAKIAELYMATGGEFMISARDRIVGTGHPQEKVMESAAHLAEHLAEVPAIVIPTIIGVHDNSGRPGLFDSVIQSVWSFSIALRARGLGTAYTTAILGKQAELVELLGIPAENTPIAMIPVAWAKGTGFRQAPRYPAREITFMNNYGTTWASGPSDPPCLADGPGTVVEIDIKAKAADVWAMISDPAVSAKFSGESLGAVWAEGFDGPALGAQFVGTNKHKAIGEWDVQCFVHRFVEGKEFGWVTSDADNPGAQWCFEVASIAGSVRLRYSLIIGPGPSGISHAISNMPDREADILNGRVREHRGNMQKVLEGIKEALHQEPDPERANPIFDN